MCQVEGWVRNMSSLEKKNVNNQSLSVANYKYIALSISDVKFGLLINGKIMSLHVDFM